MKKTEWMGRALAAVKKYRWALLVLLVGVALLLLPSRGESGQEQRDRTEQAASDLDASYRQELEQRLSELLSGVEGAGEVRVLLTLKTASQTRYQTDTSSTEDTDASGSRRTAEEKTVILSEGSSYNAPAVRTVDYPVFQGAVVACGGAGSAAVRLSLTNAVSALTGLSAEKITVVKLN